MTVWTIGHSTHSLDEFLALLRAYGIEAVADVRRFPGSRRTTLMCAETLWWRCHRSLIADVLLSRGIEVIHILDATHSTPHPYTSPARILDGELAYP